MELETSSVQRRRRFATSCPPPHESPHPWLVISHGKHMQRQTFFSISQDRRHVRTIPELCSKWIWARCDQWLVLTDLTSPSNSFCCWLFNIVSMERIQLPSVELPYSRELCVLTSPPSHSDCRVVFFDRNSQFHRRLRFWKPGEDKFDEQVFHDMGDDCWLSASTFKEKIYALTDSSKLFMIDFSSSNPKPHKIPMTTADVRRETPLDLLDFDKWLVESDGELLYISLLNCGHLAKQVYGFVVKRYNFQENSWDDVKSLGERRALFLCDNWGVSCLATEESKIQGNSIYFNQSTWWDDRCIYVFDLEKQTISYSLPCPDVHRGRRRSQFYGIRWPDVRRSKFYWIPIPDHDQNKSLVPMAKTDIQCKQRCSTMKKNMESCERSGSKLKPTDKPTYKQSLTLSLEESSERSWSELLPDMLSLILSSLFAGDLVIFNMVCISWRSITPVRALPPPVNSKFSGTPCLVTLNNQVCEFYHPVYNATYKIDTPHESLSGARIRSSGYGWLLMSKKESVFFFNPFTEAKINLPYYPYLDRLSTINFSSPPTSPDCLVIGTMYCRYEEVKLMTIRHGEAEWTFWHSDNPFHKKFIPCTFCSPLFSKGKCYFLGDTGNIGVFDAEDNSWDVLGKAWSARERALLRPSSMVENDGALLAVFLTRECRHVQIRRFDLSKMMWEDVERLGSDKMLYVSNGASYLETSTIGRGMGNKICFPKFYGDKVGVFYCLSTKMYRSFDGKYSNKYPFRLFERRSCTWIKPHVYTESVVVEDHQLKWC